jgi:dTDP-4-dehydrorhamnose 3,5-epimerase
MKVDPLQEIPGALIGTPELHEDSRGYFLEIFREDLLGTRFVQGNHSHSKAGVLRGLHYHRKQSDAWYAIAGDAQAMLVDLRSPSDKPSVRSIELSASKPSVLFIPPGVAHGFLAITEVDLIYWVTHPYDASDEFGVAWDDPKINAPWRLSDPILSDRDRSNPSLDWELIEVSS